MTTIITTMRCISCCRWRRQGDEIKLVPFLLDSSCHTQLPMYNRVGFKSNCGKWIDFRLFFLMLRESYHCNYVSYPFQWQSRDKFSKFQLWVIQLSRTGLKRGRDSWKLSLIILVCVHFKLSARIFTLKLSLQYSPQFTPDSTNTPNFKSKQTMRL